jgi:Putative transposase
MSDAREGAPDRGTIGITMMLHTWGQNLSQHLHVYCPGPAGHSVPRGSGSPAKRGFLFPVRALSVVFRGKYLAALQQAFEAGQLSFAGDSTLLAVPPAFHAFLAKLRAKDWVIYANPTFSTGGGSRPGRRIDPTVRPKGLHYKWAWSRQCTSRPAAVIRGGGWGGRVRPSRSSRSRCSGLGSV